MSNSSSSSPSSPPHASSPGWVTPAIAERVRNSAEDQCPLLWHDYYQQWDWWDHQALGGGYGPGVHHQSVGPGVLGLLTSSTTPSSNSTWLTLWSYHYDIMKIKTQELGQECPEVVQKWPHSPKTPPQRSAAPTHLLQLRVELCPCTQPVSKSCIQS